MGKKEGEGKPWLTQGRLAVLVIVAVLVADQLIKIAVKTNMYMHESIRVTDWFYILFTENPGMAFGWEFFDKLFLTSFRIVAVGLLAYYLHTLIKKQWRTGYVLVIALLLAGAAGNIFDSVFYGVLFGPSTYYDVATFLPEGGGYAPLFHGKVVDMLYFPIIRNAAGETIFFSPVFNIADSAITVAVFLILLFFRKDFNDTLDGKKKQHAETAE